MVDREATQYGPWPSELESLVAQARYRDGWRFTLTEEERTSFRGKVGDD